MTFPRSNPPALVLGTGLTALGVIRSLARAGIESIALSDAPDFEARSRFYRPHTRLLGPWASAGELGDLLEQTGLGGGVLIPCSDHWAVEITRLPSPVSDRFRASAPPTDVVETFVDKDRFHSELLRAGVAHPFTAPIGAESDLAALMERAPAGAFLKPVDSQRFVSTFGLKAFRVADARQAAACYRRAREHDIDLVVQEYVDGGADRHVFVDGFVDAGHRIHTAVARRRLRMHPPDFGNSSAVRSIDPADLTGVVDALQSLFASAGYRGIFSAEFKQDARDGVFKLLEVNCRPWWYVYFCTTCGVNVVEMAYRDALGHELPAAAPGATGRELIYSYYDYHACRRLIAAGEAGALDCLGSWLQSDKAIFAWSDPAPAVSNLGRRVRAWIRVRVAGR